LREPTDYQFIGPIVAKSATNAIKPDV